MLRSCPQGVFCPAAAAAERQAGVVHRAIPSLHSELRILSGSEVVCPVMCLRRAVKALWAVSLNSAH